MSNSSPTATLTRKPSLTFCLNRHHRHRDWICTRLESHGGHCCDEVAGQAWDAGGRPMKCARAGHDHSAEKGLVTA